MKRRYWGVAAVILSATVPSPACDGSHTVTRARAPRLEPAVDHLLDAFRRYPIVAFSEPRHAADPDRILVALAVDRKDLDEAVAQRLGAWPALMAARVGNTWLGGVDAASDAGMRLSTGD